MSPEPSARLPRPRPPFFGLRRLRWRDLRWLDALVFSMPLWLVLLFLVAAPMARYLDARVFSDWWTRSESLARLADAQLHTLARLPEALSLSLRLDAEHPDPRWIRLHVDRDVWNEWQSEPLALHGDWVEATLLEGPRLHEVKLRKRGDTSVHWLTPKKSFTLKTGRGDLVRGHRRLSFSAKTPVEQVVVGQLARDWGLLAPETFLAPVFVNDRFYGVFRASELVDESLLRRAGRMPGDVFRGDTAERGENYRGLARNLWHSPALWERVARNDRPTRPAVSGLERLLGNLVRTDLSALDEREHLVDRGELARLLAFLLVVGDPYHMTNLHNQFWYEDPSSGRLHPIVWDIRLLALDAAPPHPLNSGFLSLLRDPRLFDEVMTELARRHADGSLLGGSEERLAAIEQGLEGPLRFEALRRGVIPDLTDPSQVGARLQANAATVADWIDDAQVSVAAGDADAAGWRILDVTVAGHAAVEWVGFEAADGPVAWVADADRNGRRDPSDPRGVASPGSETARLRLVPAVSAADWRLAPAPQHYRFFVRGEAAPRFVNALTGAPVAAGRTPPGTSLATAPGHHLWALPGHSPGAVAPPAPVTRLAGALELRESLRIPEGGRLEIAPGSVLRLGADVSILSRGRVVAQGTPEAPIRIEALDPKRPWGAFALLGEGASGSRFRHVEFRWGGGAELDSVEFKGMVDVHHAHDVVFDACRFRDNLRSDDALNAVHAQVDVRHSEFLNANADAIDFDYSRGEIRGNRFVAAGNDAIDLMTSSPRIVDNEIEGSGDKGVSIGEASAPWIEGNAIRGCVIGFEVKDRSAPWLVANRLEGNGVDLLQQVKNWRYGGGGRAKWIGPGLAPAGLEVAPDASSRLTLEEGAAAPAWVQRPLLAEMSFESRFEPLTPDQSWEVRGARTRLDRAGDELVLRARKGRAGARRRFSAPGPGLGLLEYSLAAGGRAELHWRQGEREHVVPLTPTKAPGQYAFATWPLAAGGEGRLTLLAEPAEGTGRGELRIQALRFLGEAP